MTVFNPPAGVIVPATLNLPASRNGTLQAPFQLLFPVNGVLAPFDATGWVGELQFRTQAGATGSALLSLGTNLSPTPNGSSLAWTDITQSSLLLTVAVGDWDLFTPLPIPPTVNFIASYDLVLIYPNATQNPWVTGQLVLNPGTTIT